MILRFLLCIPITLILIGCSSKKGDINKMPEEVEVLELIVPKDTINSPVSRWKKLQVKGTKLCDSRGDSIQLRGISSHGLQYPGAANITEKNICYLAEKWKCNVFRIVITAEDEGGGYYRNPTHKYRYLENTVKWCGESGIYCIITWGVLNPGNPQDSIYRNHYFPDKGKHIDMAKDFFTYCSRRFKKQKHVIYELCSEPNSRNYDGKNFKKQEHVKHLDGLKYGSIPLDSLNWWKGLVEPYCQEMIKVIRDNGDLAVIICGSPNYSQSPDIERARDFLDKNKNIMFGLNVYSDNRTEIIDKNGDTREETFVREHIRGTKLPITEKNEPLTTIAKIRCKLADSPIIPTTPSS